MAVLSPRRRRLVPLLLSGAVHGGVIAALVLMPSEREAPSLSAPAPVAVQLVPPRPAPEPEPAQAQADEPSAEPAAPAPATPANAPAKVLKPRPERTRPAVSPTRVAATPTPAPIAVESGGYGFTEASDAQVAGAASTDGGGRGGGRGPGGRCDMLGRLQASLRRDRMAQAAMTEAHRGRPILVWDGAWVRHPSQEGAGLASVREAILWEVGFAPEDCRQEQVQGTILISMSDQPGAARLVLGAGRWRWSDLLFTRGSVRR